MYVMCMLGVCVLSIQQQGGATALIIAALKPYDDCVSTLLAAGANKEATTKVCLLAVNGCMLLCYLLLCYLLLCYLLLCYLLLCYLLL